MESLDNVIRTIIAAIAFMVFSLMLVEQYFPKFYGYLRTAFDFYILKRYRKPFPERHYRYLENRLEFLREKNKARYEQRLLQEILDECGKYRAKMTGKCNNKVRYKIKKQGAVIKNY